MAVEGDIVVALNAAQVLASPGVGDLVAAVAKVGDLGEGGSSCSLVTEGVQQENESTLLALASPELSRVGRVEGPVRVGTPLVRSGRGSVGLVLVEGKEVLVLEDGEVVVGDDAEIGADDERGLHGSPESEVRPGLLGSEITVTNLCEKKKR